MAGSDVKSQCINSLAAVAPELGGWWGLPPFSCSARARPVLPAVPVSVCPCPRSGKFCYVLIGRTRAYNEGVALKNAPKFEHLLRYESLAKKVLSVPKPRLTNVRRSNRQSNAY